MFIVITPKETQKMIERERKRERERERERVFVKGRFNPTIKLKLCISLKG